MIKTDDGFCCSFNTVNIEDSFVTEEEFDGENANDKQGSADCALEEHVDPASSSSSRALTGFQFVLSVGYSF